MNGCRLFLMMCAALLLGACTGDRTVSTLDTSTDDTTTVADTTTEDVVEDTRQPCLVQNGDGFLVDLRCQIERCYEDFDDCDGDSLTGCEARLDNSTSHCGACDNACGAGESCVEGACVCGDEGAPCAEGALCCQGQCVAPDHPSCACGDQESCGTGQLCCADVCEDVLSSTAHCGACGSACGTNEACDDGSCACQEGFADCDEDPSNGCEVQTTSEVVNCGACGVECGNGESCVNGACVCGSTTGATGVAACAEGTICCGGEAGACVAPTDPSCACGGQASCASDELCCSDSCTGILQDSANCGACGAACQGDEVCQGGSCGCPSGRTSCGGGVCADLLTDTQNCGACGESCAAGDSCCGGTCIDTSTNPLHCGGCFADGGTRCGSNGVCVAGTCGCKDSFQDCDGSPGCETYLLDATSCGGCNIECGLNSVCSENAVCECGQGFEDCNNNGDCSTDLLADNNNCGACFDACGTGQVCTNGVCTNDCSCESKECGDNGCGTSCGTCETGWTCDNTFTCQPPTTSDEHTIFATSGTYSGDFGGGLALQDYECQRAGSSGNQTSGMNLSWVALMSDPVYNINARDRVRWSGPVFNTIGQSIEPSPTNWPWSPIDNPVGYDENGTNLGTSKTHTGTLDNGQADAGWCCEDNGTNRAWDWGGSSSPYGTAGRISSTSGSNGWLDGGGVDTCNGLRHLYCVNVRPEAEHYIFATSLQLPGFEIRDLTNADQICQQAGDNGSATPKGRVWVALMSDYGRQINARDRLAWRGPVYNLNPDTGQNLVESNPAVWPWAPLDNPVRFDENGTDLSTLSFQKTHTGTRNDGTADPDDCSGNGEYAWSANANVTAGRLNSTQGNNGWMDGGGTDSCSNTFRIYCVSR